MLNHPPINPNVRRNAYRRNEAGKNGSKCKAFIYFLKAIFLAFKSYSASILKNYIQSIYLTAPCIVREMSA